MKKDLCEFGIVDKACYFCDQPRTIRFNEHYTFCPNCSAIYTFCIIQESNCEHIKDRVPSVDHAPAAINHEWVKGGVEFHTPGNEKPYLYEECINGEVLERCSICKAECCADGW